MRKQARPSVSLHGLYGALLWILGMAPLVITVLSPRRFDQEYQDFVMSLAHNPEWAGAWLGRAANLACCAIGLCIFAGLLATRRRILSRNGLGLWLASLAPFASTALASLFGTVPAFSGTPLVGSVVFTTAYVAPRVSLDWFVRQVKLVLLTYAYASLVAAAFVPSWATQYPYGEGWIPGLSFRLHGATAHANTLGPLMALYLILTSHAPTRMRGENMHRAVAIGLLILSQSKSTWGALLVAGAVHRGLEVWASRHRLQAPQGRRSIAGHGLTLVVFAILASVALPLVQPWPAVSRSVSYLQSYYPVVGRMLLWDVTIQLWRENPWFGYGPTLWGPSMSSQLLSVLRWAPGSAHNQLFQTLGESGLVGVICLFVYLTALVVAGLRRAAGSPLPLTLVVLLSVRGAAEAVFRGGPDSLSFFMHFVAYGILLASDNKCVDHSLATPSGGGRL